MGTVQEIDLLRLSLSLRDPDVRHRVCSDYRQFDADERGK